MQEKWVCGFLLHLLHTYTPHTDLVIITYYGNSAIVLVEHFRLTVSFISKTVQVHLGSEN